MAIAGRIIIEIKVYLKIKYVRLFLELSLKCTLKIGSFIPAGSVTYVCLFLELSLKCTLKTCLQYLRRHKKYTVPQN